MSPIWEYRDRTWSAVLLNTAYRSRTCPCCADSAQLSIADRVDKSDGERYSVYLSVMCCERCGWWVAAEDEWDSSCGTATKTVHRLSATGAALQTFSEGLCGQQLTDLEKEIRSHILGEGKSVRWSTLEDATKGVFKEFGFEARVTARSKDGGVDVIVEHHSLGSVYAQVKHTRNKVGVRILRELVGTMAINGVTNSLLVTSSGFTKGVLKESRLAASKGFKVELVDGQRLLAALNLTYRLAPPTIAELLAVAKPNVQLMLEEVEL